MEGTGEILVGKKEIEKKRRGEGERERWHEEGEGRGLPALATISAGLASQSNTPRSNDSRDAIDNGDSNNEKQRSRGKRKRRIRVFDGNILGVSCSSQICIQFLLNSLLDFL